MEVWILFSVANAYDQPDKAFEELFWEKPTHKDLEKHGFTEEESRRGQKNNYDSGGAGDYWIERFKKPKK